MTPRRPYLIRALYEWILDNQLTPYILVDATQEGVRVPEQFIQNGKIVLNIAPRSVEGLIMGNEALQFSARFSGVPHSLLVPAPAVLAIYARENGQGMVFADEGDQPPEPTPPEPPSERPSHLKLVK